MSLEIVLIVAGLCSLVCLIDWRIGLHLCILVDVLRDPARKLAEGQSVAITLVGLMPWAAVFAGAYIKEHREIHLMFVRYPAIRKVMICVILAILPAAGLSAVLYRSGWMLSAVGSIAYLVPLAGIAVGFVLARSENQIYAVLRTYSIVNAIALIGVPLEKFHIDVPALGGIDTVWVRYRSGYVVELISGFYRSPDIMGLHAAHVMLFSLLLALRAKGASRVGYLGIALWSSVGLLLCGRRKMVGMPLVFFVTYYAFCRWRGLTKTGGRAIALSMGLMLAGAVALALNDQSQGYEYTDYALTMFTEGHQRVSTNVLGGVLSTLYQVGILGGGLGSATQGRYYLGIQTSRAARGWQEDGISRLFMELGLPGVLLMIVAAIQLVVAARAAFKCVNPRHAAQLLQIGLMSIVLANAVSYLFAHQQYSGDPVTALLVTLMYGVVLGAPRIYAADLARQNALKDATNEAARRVRPGATGSWIRPGVPAPPRTD